MGTEADGPVRPVHGRMPVTEDPADDQTWLDTDTHLLDVEPLRSTLRPCPRDATEGGPVGPVVSDRVSDPRDDEPRRVTPLCRTRPGAARGPLPIPWSRDARAPRARWEGWAKRHE